MIHFDLTDLRLFICVADASSLTKGARRAFISPAAASMRIKALEEQLGTQIFYRDRKGVVLTDSGKKLMKHARIVLRDVERLKSEFSATDGQESGHVRIFANTTAVTDFLPEVLADFLSSRPALTVDLQERPSVEIVRGVVEGAADMGIIAGPVQVPDIDIVHFSTDKLVLAVPVGHELASRTTITLGETCSFRHIGLQEGSTLHSFLAEQAQKLGRKLDWRIQLTNFESVCRMVSANVGVSIMPESATRRSVAEGLIATVQLQEAWAVRERSILVKALSSQPAFVRELVDMLVKHHLA